MSKLKVFCAKSVFEIDYSALRSCGIRGLIFDIDGTLVPHGAFADKKTEELFQHLHREGILTVLLTNNCAARSAEFAEAVVSQYICDAEKPKKDGFYVAMKTIGTKKCETVVVGDRLYDDIFGARRCGIASILVDYVRHNGETRLGKYRRLEIIIVGFFLKIGMISDVSEFPCQGRKSGKH